MKVKFNQYISVFFMKKDEEMASVILILIYIVSSDVFIGTNTHPIKIYKP